MEMANCREPSQMVGDFLREAAALITVLRPLEDGMKNEQISGTVMVFFCCRLVFWCTGESS
jgi:hypothetical protein